MSNEHNSAPVHTILIILAILFWAFAAVPYTWGPEPWPWRERFIAAGLFCWGLATFF